MKNIQKTKNGILNLIQRALHAGSNKKMNTILILMDYYH